MDKSSKKKMAEELLEVVTQPQFIDFIHDIENQPSKSRFDYAKEVTSVSELEKRGVTVPKDFKITLRTFEGRQLSSHFDNAPETAAVARKGWSICAGTIVTIGYEFPE